MPAPSEPFFELSLDPLVTAGFDGYIKRTNQAWEHTLGWTEGELRAVPYAEFIHPDDRERTAAEATALAAPGHETRGFEIRLRRRDGAYRLFRFMATAWISLRSASPTALGRQPRGPAGAARRELERSNQELERFAYVASHVLSEPLRMISGFASLLQTRYGGRLDADADQFIRYIVEGAGRMQELIRDLLTYSRVGRAQSRADPVDTAALVTHVLEMLQTSIDETGATIRVDALPTVRGDSSQIQQLVQNLVANALKFTHDAAPVVRISAERDGPDWRFTGGGDQGIGIDTHDAERIFQVFQRLHRPEDYPGTGVGPAICRTIVERHGGRIWVEPGPQGGSVFLFTLPAMQETPDHGR